MRNVLMAVAVGSLVYVAANMVAFACIAWMIKEVVHG